MRGRVEGGGWRLEGGGWERVLGGKVRASDENDRADRRGGGGIGSDNYANDGDGDDDARH